MVYRHAQAYLKAVFNNKNSQRLYCQELHITLIDKMLALLFLKGFDSFAIFNWKITGEIRCIFVVEIRV